MKISDLFVLAPLILFPMIPVQAESISGSVIAAPETGNLSNASAFGYYGVNGLANFQNISGTATTDISNKAHFSSLSLVAGAPNFLSANGGGIPFAVTYTGAASAQNTPQQNSANGSLQFAFATGVSNGQGFSFTTTLIAASETVSVFLQNFDVTSNLTATLGGGATFNLNQQVLPQALANGDGTGTGQTGGVFKIQVTGTVGETLTVTDTANFTGVSNTQYGNVGINAASVSAVAAPVTVDIAPMTWTPRSDWVNVKSAPYNATGNGSTDDTSAIQAAFNAVATGTAPAGNGGTHASTVYFPAGTYKISSTLTLVNCGGGLQVIGCGINSTIKWAGAAGGAMFLQSNLQNMRYIGLVWDGGGTGGINGTGGASCAIQDNPNNAYESEIRHENESFKNFTVPSTYSYYTSTTASTTTPAVPAAAIIDGFPSGITGEMRIYNCHFSACTNGAVPSLEDFQYYMWHIDGCEFDNCGVGFNGFGYGGSFAVTDTHFQGSTVADISGLGAIRVRHCTSTGSQTFIARGGGVNVFQDCWVDGWKDPEGAIQVASSGSGTIFDCTFTNPPPGGLGAIRPYLGYQGPISFVLSNNAALDFPGTNLINGDQNITDTNLYVPPGIRFTTLTSPSQTFLKNTWPADSTHILDVTLAPYNAKDDFSADATSAIQSALSAAATANNGSVVYFPAGEYKITSTLNAPTGRYSIEGAGSRSLPVWWGASNSTVLTIATPQSMLVQGLQFYILNNPSGADTSAPTCDPATITCIQETSTGTSSITYDNIEDWFFNPNGAGLGPSAANQNGPGLKLTNLPAGSTVSMEEAQLPLTVQNSSAAQIFCRMGDGVITVSGTSAKTGFLGTEVAEGGQQTVGLYDIVVNDNQNLVVGDLYTEQIRNDLQVSRGSGTTPGHVTIEGFVSTAGVNNGQGNSPTMSINANNYAGRLFYESQGFSDNGGQSPVQITATGSNPLDLILVLDDYTDGLSISPGSSNLIQALNSDPAIQPALTPANLISTALGFDDLRQLEAVDLSINHGIVTDAPPIAAYPLESNALDETTSYNGTNQGATFVPGVVGAYAAQFNGTTSYITIPKSISTNFSIAMWIQTTDTGATGSWNVGRGLVDATTTGTVSDFGTALNAGCFSLGIGNPNTTLTSTVPVNDGNWHHLVATRNTTTGLMQIFVDGVLNGTATGPTGTRSAGSIIRMGSLQTGAAGGFFNGALDQVQIYNYVISASDVASLYTRTKPFVPQMVAHWRLDETAGPTSVDSSGHGVNGNWQNGPVFTTNKPTAITFSDPGSLSFNGSNQYVSMSNLGVLPAGRNARTMCAWAKSNGASGYNIIAAYGAPATAEGFIIGCNGTALAAGSYGNDLRNVPNFWDGNWHFIALVYDGTTASLYADGVLKESSPAVWNLIPSALYIGRQLDGSGQYWNGSIDDVRIYNSALSAAKIASLAAGNP